ncbi:ABC transporter permease [Thermodesulfobacteriota bacterium]
MMAVKLVILPTDFLLFSIFIIGGGVCIYTLRKEHLKAPWQQIFRSPAAMTSLMVLIPFLLFGLMDSIHYRSSLGHNSDNKNMIYSSQVYSLLDNILKPLHSNIEGSYSSPFAAYRFDKVTVKMSDGTKLRTTPRLKFGGRHLKNPKTDKRKDIIKHITSSFLITIIFWSAFVISISGAIAFRRKQRLSLILLKMLKGKLLIPWRAIFITSILIIFVILLAIKLCPLYHVMGTDKVGQDVFYQSLKSIRTGLVVGSITTLIMLPFAIFLGTAAGYFGGWIDDIIQYLYTTLSSIPGILLIAAAILMINVYIDNHADLFNSIEQRSDLRLLALCAILGITSWTGLCRLLRGETMKIRDLDYVQAARSLGAGNFKTITRHIFPNVMHIVLITIILDFSALVLAEAVLSYIGIGVDPTMNSWGNMINSARMEMAREPIVWWPLLSAFSLMLLLVLSVNLFGDAMRDAFDPRIRKRQ